MPFNSHSTIRWYIIRKVPFVGMMGWAVNSIAKAVEGSIPSLPNHKYIHKYKVLIKLLSTNLVTL